MIKKCIFEKKLKRKKMKNLALVFFVAFSFVSCSISEQIIFNENGSGKLAFTVDMSKMIALTKDMDKSSKMTKELTESTDVDMDSLISFKDMENAYKSKGKEMTPAQVANIEAMKNYSLRMVMNKARGEMKFIVFTDFNKISEIGNVGDAFSSIKNFSGKNLNALDAANPISNSEVTFALDGKSFTRTVVEKPQVDLFEETDSVAVEDSYEESDESEVTEVMDAAIDTTVVMDTYYDDEVIDTAAVKEMQVAGEGEEVEELEATDTDAMDMKKMEKEFKKLEKFMKKGLEDSSYEFQYTFPKKIKKVSLPKSNYKLSPDKKTIFLKYGFEEFSKKIKELNLNIEFE